MTEKLLTTQEAADYLRVSKSTVYRLYSRGSLPHIKKNFGIRIRQHELEKWLEQDKRKAALADNFLRNVLTNSPPIAIDRAKGGKEVARTIKSRRHYTIGSVYQRKTGGSWAIDYRDSKGKRIQRVIRGATSQEEALLVLQNAVRKDFFQANGIKEERKPITFEELADMYLENYAKVNKRSWRGDQYRIEAHMKPYFGGLELLDVTPLLIEKYRAERLETGVTKSTVNREITIMKKMFNKAIDWNLTDKNPTLKVKLFSEKDTQKERILSEAEEARLLAECPDYLIPILTTALQTGMRRGEILNLRWKQVDLNRRHIKVEQTKNGKNRIIPINDVLYRELLIVKKLNGKGEYVFPNSETGRPFTEVKKSFKSACKRAGIHDLRFHDLRHTFATRLVMSGVDLITIRDLLGHFSIRVTQRYTHSNENQKRKAVELLTKRTQKRVENSESPLQIGDIDRNEKSRKPVSRSFLIN